MTGQEWAALFLALCLLEHRARERYLRRLGVHRDGL